MKKSIIALLVFLASASYAQNFEIGINGGIGWNTLPPNTRIIGSTNSSEKGSPPSFAGMLKVAYNYNKWRFGLETGYLTLSYKFRGLQYYYINGQLVEMFSPYQTATLGNPAIPVKIFADRKKSWNHYEIYGGISAGYVFLTHSFIPPAEFQPFPTPPNHGTGTTVGLHTGATYYFNKHIGINAEIQGNYMVLKNKNREYRLYEFPATIGIRYKL